LTTTTTQTRCRLRAGANDIVLPDAVLRRLTRVYLD
jgi:hypothetical protein